MISILRVVVPIHGGVPVGPSLVSTREFGRWMEESFADSCPEFYLAATHIKNEEGFPKHPGAYLNGFFRKHPMISLNKMQRSFKIDSQFVLECVKEGIVSLKDANKLVGDESTNYNYIKFYTFEQVKIALKPLLEFYNPPHFTRLDEHSHQIHIQVSSPPEWFYDYQMEVKTKTKQLFSLDAKPAPMEKKERRTMYKGMARVKPIGNTLEINLYKPNWNNRNWQYVNVVCTKDMILITQGYEDRYSAKVRKDGTFVTSDYCLSKLVRPGRYALEWVTERGEYRIDLQNQIMGE